MNILGINAFHGGASACLISDGELVAGAEEERFNRIKYWAGFPAKAIQYCLTEGRITAYDLDHIGISRNPSANLRKKILFTLSRRPSLELVRDRLANAGRVRDVRTILCESLSLDQSKLRAKFHNIEHHHAHMASAFYVSPYDSAAILSVDGMGDFVSTMWGVGKANTIEVLGSIHFPHSLGIFYTAVTQWLGFPKYGDEGKVMGLAPYGEPIYLDEMRRIVRIQEDGSFNLDLDYFVHHAEGATMTWDDGEPVLGRLFSKKLVQVFGSPRKPYSELTVKHRNVAASLQVMLEEAELSLVHMLQKSTNQRNLCMAGGVALNSSFNGKVLPNTEFEEIFIQPAAGDAGTSLGVCYFIYHQLLGYPRGKVMSTACIGPGFSSRKIQQALERAGIKYQVFTDEEELCKKTAELIAGGMVIGWFQGRMEWGPRALGYRSILADPRRDDMKDILNARIKHREKFRPFAPSILAEATGEYFEQDYPDPFMLKVYKFNDGRGNVVPAVMHVDGTGRLQTVDEKDSPLYWKLIKAFEKETGVPVILNTSFNENEPIVCTPEEAISVLNRTKMDALVMGDCLVLKSEKNI